MTDLPSATPRRTEIRSRFRSEWCSYRADVEVLILTAEGVRNYSLTAMSLGKHPCLGRLARLFLTVPASAIPQALQFSELKWRCAWLRYRTKAEMLDRDAVVYS